MAVPQRGTSRSKRDMRRSHHKVTKPSLMECPNCHNVKLTHTACPSCGFYKGRQVIRPREA
ncbi:MAG: 50S ribosomal protein L32 [Candidatus Hatepunaea meridiana]|nr:50S ribosomal protein L32 [Candidatus Hatepunaea meridiana]